MVRREDKRVRLLSMKGYDFTERYPWTVEAARKLVLRPEGIFVNPFERGAIGPDLFQAACNMGLQGLVSKHCDRPYQAGRSKHWIKVRNREHPAMHRIMETLS